MENENEKATYNWREADVKLLIATYEDSKHKFAIPKYKKKKVSVHCMTFSS